MWSDVPFETALTRPTRYSKRILPEHFKARVQGWLGIAV